MKLRTIWSLPFMKFSQRLKYTVDELAQCAAAVLPVRIRYWVTIQSIAKATSTYNDNIMGAPVEFLIKNIDSPKGMHS